MGNGVGHRSQIKGRWNVLNGLLFSHRLWVLSLGLGVLSSHAQSWLPPSSARRYQVQSQFGPRDVVLSPRFPRDDKVELLVGVATLPFGSLTTSQAAKVSLAYHLNRRHWVELVDFQWFQSQLTSFSTSQLRDKVPDQANGLKVEVPQWTAGASYFFSPYYSKMHLGRASVAHFDTFLGLGLEARQLETLSLSAKRSDSRMTPGVTSTAGLRFLFPSRWAVRLDLRNSLAQNDNFGTRAWSSNLQLGLGLSVYFGSFPDPILR